MTARRTRDDGAAMVLVLIVVVLMALVTTAFLTKSGTEYRAASVLQTKVRLQYGSDAGLEKGIRVMSDDLAAASRSKCLTPFTPITQIATFTWTDAGFPVTVSCQDLQGYAADSSAGLLYGAAIVTTGGAGSLQTQSAAGPSTSLDVGGTIYVSGSEVANDIKKDVNLRKGDYAQFGCSDTPVLVPMHVVPPGSRYCTSLTPSQVAPSVALPGVRPTVYVAPVTNALATCRTFFPGRYTSAPTLLVGAGVGNYFASGDYYFDGSFTMGLGSSAGGGGGGGGGGGDRPMT